MSLHFLIREHITHKSTLTECIGYIVIGFSCFPDISHTFKLSSLSALHLVTSPYRWCTSQPRFPTLCWSFCWSEEWPCLARLMAFCILLHQSGRSWMMQRCPNNRQTWHDCPFFVSKLSSAVRCGKMQPLRSFSHCRLRGEASSPCPPTISSTITATGKHIKCKMLFQRHWVITLLRWIMTIRWRNNNNDYNAA